MDTKSIERKVFTSFYKDGTLDLISGLIFLFFALTVFATRLQYGDFVSVIAVFIPIIIIYYSIKLIRKKITIPRLGTIVFSKQRKKKTKSILLIPIITICIGIVIYFAYPNKPEGFLNTILFSLGFLIVFSVAAYLTSTIRLALYGVLGSAAFAAGKLLERTTEMSLVLPVLMLVVSGIAFLIGIVQLVTFIKNNPVRDIGEENE